MLTTGMGVSTTRVLVAGPLPLLVPLALTRRSAALPAASAMLPLLPSDKVLATAVMPPSLSRSPLRTL